MRRLLLITFTAMLAVCSARAQSQVEATIRNQYTGGDTLFFDLYIRVVSGPDVYLENSDFIFSYDEANFTTPEFGMVSNSSSLTNSNGAPTTHYNSNIYTRFGEALNAGNLMVMVALPAFSSQPEFDARIAVIDGQAATHRLGTFYLTGMQNMSQNPNFTWKTNGEGVNTQVFSLNDSTWNADTTVIQVQAQDPDPTTEPGSNSSGIAFSNVTNISLTLTIGTPGDGARRLIMAKATASIGTDHPADGFMYTPAEFGSGSQIGSTGVYAVYDGTEDTVDITGLSPNTLYFFEVYEYNGANGQTENYLIPGVEVSQMTEPEPSVNSSDITFSSVGSTSMTLTIGTTGNGARRLILARAASAVGSNDPLDGTTYTANSVFGQGTQIGSSGVYAVYDGTGNSVTVTGLSATTTYHFEVYEYNMDGVEEDYLVSGAEANETTTAAYITVNVKALLQGPYSGGQMTTLLNSKGYLPTSQPYNTTPWNYNDNGEDAVNSIPNADIVDWVLVELRSGTASSTLVTRKACFIKKDGSIVGTDGSSQPQFTGVSAGDYYVVIKHRNHLAIMSASALSLSSNSSLYDFTTGASQAYGSGALSLGAGKYGMYAGDGNSSGSFSVIDQARARLGILNGLSGYQIGDYNLSGDFSAIDQARARLGILNGWNTQVP